MSDFTALVKRISRRIPDRDLRREVEDELLDHLEAAVLRLQAQGLPLEDATELAMDQLGDPDEIGKELGRVHNGVKFRLFAIGGLLWYLAGALIFESNLLYMAANWRSPVPYWIVQLPFQVLGLPHWFALQSPQIQSLTFLDPLGRWLGRAFGISGWHVDAVVGIVVLTGAAYGVCQLVRALKGWPRLHMAYKR